MSKNWYPVIDYINCAECGSCVDKCTHGVYDAIKSPTPFVINGDNCIEGCHGCGSICPNGAITYFGDNTGWSPESETSDDNGSCGCGSDCRC